MKKIIPKWHKEWDKSFKKILDKEVAVSGCGIEITMNEHAKQVIQGLLDQNTRNLFERHNLLVLSYDKLQGLKCNRATIKKMIEGNIQATDDVKKDLLELFKEMKKI